MRIVAGAWRGKALAAPPGQATRPTADRVRQALFDRLMHAPWAGRSAIEAVSVLDAFAGTGALGLEALSRGAAHATFIENDRTALAVLRANVAACAAPARIVAADAMHPPKGSPCGLVFLDPPYGKGLVPRALAALANAGWIAPDALLVMELGRNDDFALDAPLADFSAGAARVVVSRAPPPAPAASPPGRPR